MCGICGFVGHGSETLLRHMNEQLFHRGPDDSGFLIENDVHFAMRRLSIVDLETGAQPTYNEDRSVAAVFNGEIYNHAELRLMLEQRGHRFRSNRSDSETIVHLYEEFGDEWPIKGEVNGMFAIAIWDRRRKRVLLYRDRLGKKPLYWAATDNTLVFGSEIKAVRAHPGVSSEIDPVALGHYFSLKHTRAPATAFRDIKQVDAGHYLIWENGSAETRCYWSVNFSKQVEDTTDEAVAEHYIQLLDDAVRIRMHCDVPYGAYLSGGIDSSLVVALMSRHQSQPVQTFCLGYEEEAEGQFDGKAQDLAKARWMSEVLGTEHHELILTAEKFAQSMPAIIRSFDEPFSGTVSTFPLSALISKHVKVALSGDGADELMGSYLPHRLAQPFEAYRNLGKPKNLKSLTRDESRTLAPFDTPEQFEFLKYKYRDNQHEWRMALAVFDRAGKNEILGPELREAAMSNDTADVYDKIVREGTAKDPLNEVLEVDQRELLANEIEPFMDRLSMAHSVEVRSPFLDYRIVEFANQLPGNLKIRDGICKYVHKLAASKFLPKEVVDRPKEGFVQPIYTWMRTTLKPWTLDMLSPERLGQHGFLNVSAVERLLQQHFENSFDHSARIWNLICFQIWYENVLASKV